MGYILIFGEDEYVESYHLGNKEVTTSPVRKDAIEFENKENAEFIAERVGARVVNT
ncbi:hypothetical protein [Salimicrobium album]|uniref:hypothetical protein n=1 Tax=Salimicrobium album TaxID=50717 RepID=UPI0015A2F794|nr:hypothetical protein [Salimicrobium album]